MNPGYQVIGVNERAIGPRSVKVRGTLLTFSGTVSMACADDARRTGPRLPLSVPPAGDIGGAVGVGVTMGK
jgi:hypothetical protein